MRKKKVAVAMSGGVDSSVAAAILREKGFEVIGLTMDIYHPPKEPCSDENFKSCRGRNVASDADHVAAQLQIPHFVIDLKRTFEKWVIEDFCREYARGRTPNPCIRCNRYVKFDALWSAAEELGADFLATGHHARIVFDKKTGAFLLKKGRDRAKDQSYFLYTLTQEQLGRSLTPIGDFTKQKVREKARRLGLAAHQRPESQEICFIPDADYVNFLRQRKPGLFKPGHIVDNENRFLGGHKGILRYTVGQRKGIGLASPHPLYVLEIRPGCREIVVGDKSDLYKKKLIVSHLNFISGKDIDTPLAVKAKIRYKHRESEAVLSLLDRNLASLEFVKPQRAPTPGQSAVFYREDQVIGGGIIAKAEF